MGRGIQRTVVLTVDDAGAAVGERLTRLLDEWRSPPVVTVLHLEWTPQSAHEAVVTAVDKALLDVSRLSHRTRLRDLGYNTARLNELVVWIVGEPDRSLSSLASLTRERADAILGVEPLTMALYLEAAAGITGARSEVGAVDATSPGGSNVGPLPSETTETGAFAFTGPRYLAASVNEAGLTLEDRDALYQRAGRFLALHICTPLRDTPTWVGRSRGWEDSLDCASFGLTWVRWPAEVATKRAARRLAQGLISHLVGAHEADPDPDALLRGAELAMPYLLPRLTPAAVREAVQIAEGAAPSYGVLRLFKSPQEEEHPVLVSLDRIAEGWIDRLDKGTLVWEELMQDEIKAVIALTRSWARDALDRGGLRYTRRLVEMLARRLGEWAGGAEQRGMELREELSQIKGDARETLDELRAVLEKLPERRFRDLFRLLRRPTHWIQLLIRCRKVLRISARYLMLRTAMLVTRVTIEQMERACGVYWAAGSELQSISGGLDALERGLVDLLSLEDEVVQWPEGSLLLGQDPDGLLRELEEQYLPGPRSMAEAFLEAFGPLSHLWAGDLPRKERIEQWLEEQVSPLADLPVGDVVRCRFPQPDSLLVWLEELAAQAAPLWRWDAASLSDDQRAGVDSHTVILIAPSSGFCQEQLPWQALPLTRSDGMALVALRWGLPDWREKKRQIEARGPEENPHCRPPGATREVESSDEALPA